MVTALHPPEPLGVWLLVLDREARAKLRSPWFWVVAAVVCLIAWVYGAGFLQTFQTESVLVTTDPLMALNIAVVVFLSVVLGIRLAASMAWEREHRTLEVLLVGPAGWVTIITAKLAAELCVLVALVVIYAIYLIAAQPLGHGVVGLREIASLATMPVFGLPTLALGLLVGASTGSVRGAVILCIAVMVLLAGFELALGLLTAAAPDQLGLSSLYLRAGLEAVAPFLRPFSAMASLARPVDALFAQASLVRADMLRSLLLVAGIVAAAVLAGRARGTL